MPFPEISNQRQSISRIISALSVTLDRKVPLSTRPSSNQHHSSAYAGSRVIVTFCKAYTRKPLLLALISMDYRLSAEERGGVEQG
jgi:hypothetical protein